MKMIFFLLLHNFHFTLSTPCPCEASRRLGATNHQDKIELLPYPNSLTLQNLQSKILQFTESNICKPLPPDLATKYYTSTSEQIQICPQNHACLPLEIIPEDLHVLSSNMSIASPFVSFNNNIYAIDADNVLIKANTSIVKDLLHLSVPPSVSKELAFFYLHNNKLSFQPSLYHLKLCRLFMDDFEKQSMFYKAIGKLTLAAQQIEDFKERVKLPKINKLKLTLDRSKRQSLFSDPWGWLVSQFSDSGEVLKKVKTELKTIEHSYLNGSTRNLETLKILAKDRKSMGADIDMFKFQYLVNQVYQIMRKNNAIYLQHLQEILENILLTKQQLEDLHESTTTLLRSKLNDINFCIHNSLLNNCFLQQKSSLLIQNELQLELVYKESEFDSLVYYSCDIHSSKTAYILNQLSMTAPIHNISIDTLCNTRAITSQDTFLSLPDLQVNLIVLLTGGFKLSCLPNTTVQVNNKDYRCNLNSKDNEPIPKFKSLKINKTEYLSTELNKYSISWDNITNQNDPNNLHLFANHLHTNDQPLHWYRLPLKLWNGDFDIHPTVLFQIICVIVFFLGLIILTLCCIVIKKCMQTTRLGLTICSKISKCFDFTCCKERLLLPLQNQTIRPTAPTPSFEMSQLLANREVVSPPLSCSPSS